MDTAEYQALLDRVADLESQIDFLVNFSVIDPELATKLLGFWLASFVGAHAIGRAVRAMGKL